MKAKDLYDIAIIGTGPAGATLARLLHPKYKIIAIDKKNPHGDGFQKPCGGLICTDAQKTLASFDLTLPKDVLVDPQIFAVKTIDLKNKLIRHYQRFYINMDRHKFDLWLESLLPKTVELHSNAVCTELKRENGGFLISYQDLETKHELQRMEDALDELQRRVDSGAFAPIEDDEDEATALERGLLQIAGDELGGKLRAGRSRNDQIAALIRMWLRRHSRVIAKMLLGLAATLTEQAEKAGRTVMPGRTHMQHAQPVLLAHQLMAHVWPLLRDVERLADWDKRIDASPYGSGALAGNTLGLEPVAVARELGFSKVTANSIDGTASRDLVAEFAFIAAMAGVDISRLSEEIIIWNTQEFAFVRLDDAYSTGSSIMPKKTPDIAELARGKSGRLIGDLAGLLTTLKGLPTAYARDLQEDKEAVFDQVDTLEVLLPAFTGMVGTMVFNKERLEAEAPTGFALATDIAEWLVKNGVPFRHAHELSGACVKIAEDRGQELWDLADDDFIEVFKEFLPADKAPEVREVLSTEGSVSARNGKGGTSPLRVREQIVSAKTAIEQLRAFANSVSDGPAYKTPESLLK